jgi:hypothetical protein
MKECQFDKGIGNHQSLGNEIAHPHSYSDNDSSSQFDFGNLGLTTPARFNGSSVGWNRKNGQQRPKPWSGATLIRSESFMKWKPLKQKLV